MSIPPSVSVDPILLAERASTPAFLPSISPKWAAWEPPLLDFGSTESIQTIEILARAFVLKIMSSSAVLLDETYFTTHAKKAQVAPAIV
jgi:hypothetical protein